MLTIQDIFDDLAYGELANLAIGQADSGNIKRESYPKVVSAINLALVEIYKRFNLSQGTLILHQDASVTTYYLRSEHAETIDCMNSDTYIEETDELPFPDDLLKVLTATDSDGNEVRINDRKYPADLFTPSYDVINLAAPSSTNENADGNTRTVVDVFTIKYQAKYPKLYVKENFDPEKIKLYIPDFIEAGLLIYVTYRLQKKPVKLLKGETSPSDTLMIEFENEMKKITDLKLAIEVEDERDPFTAKGWV